MASSKKYGFCPKCGYAYVGTSIHKCPKCGVNIEKWKKQSPYIKLFYGITGFIFLLMVLITYLYFTNEGVANEFRQIRQPRPNKFFIGIDVSATIDPDMLDAVKSNVIARLRNFIGDSSVSYQILTFGSPGCGLKSVTEIVTAQSPADESTFKWEIEKKIQEISVSKVPTTITTIDPLTTPLYCLMEKVLQENIGGRLIFFTDMMNDDSDCQVQFAFPEETIRKFGSDLNGQLIFLYPTPKLTEKEDLNEKILSKQEAFLKNITKINMEGNVRSSFSHIPDSPKKRTSYIESKLKDSIPATNYEVVKERVLKIADTLVSAVRG
jgi:hypothetical protein